MTTPRRTTLAIVHALAESDRRRSVDLSIRSGSNTIWLCSAPGYWRQGFGTEAVRRLVAFA
jgi:RimJ/RimL family protein N-acetyltransferase